MPKKIDRTETVKADKLAYVKRQGQTRDHHCHWPGCGRQVPPTMWGCKEHWMKLPKRLRDLIWATFRPGQETNWTPSKAYVDAANEAQEWIKINYGGFACVVCNDTGATSAGRPCFSCGRNVCVACGGSGQNSKGGACYPCQDRGLIEHRPTKIQVTAPPAKAMRFGK